MEEIRKCLICGKTYTAIRPNAKYCGESCADFAFKAKRQEREKKAKEKRKSEKKKTNSISEIEIKARDAGMTYGHYVAKMSV